MLALAGCNSSSDEPEPQHKPDPLHTYNGRVIRGWLLSLERQDYEQAAYYFAPHALIDQGIPTGSTPNRTPSRSTRGFRAAPT